MSVDVLPKNSLSLDLVTVTPSSSSLQSPETPDVDGGRDSRARVVTFMKLYNQISTQQINSYPIYRKKYIVPPPQTLLPRPNSSLPASNNISPQVASTSPKLPSFNINPITKSPTTLSSVPELSVIVPQPRPPLPAFTLIRPTTAIPSNSVTVSPVQGPPPQVFYIKCSYFCNTIVYSIL